MRRKAFTLTEVVIAVLILGIMAAAMTLRPDSAKQTAKREAERIAAVISRLIEKADRNHSAFWFIPEGNTLYIVRGRTYSASAREELDFKVSGGCTVSSASSTEKGIGYNTEAKSCYVVLSSQKTPGIRVEVSSETKSDAKYTITVTGADNSACFIYIFAE